MVDMAMISGAMSAFKALRKSANALIAIRDASMLRTKVIELNTQIVTAQESALAIFSDQFALLQRNHDLEKQISDLNAWEGEKQRYELKAVDPGVFAYSLKADASDTEPPHWICAACYQQRKRSILQPLVADSSIKRRHERIWNCSTCSANIEVSYAKGPGIASQ